MKPFFENLLLHQNESLNPALGLILFVIFIWSLVWKALALWQASQNKEKIWFVILLVVNSAGILEIIYLFLVSKKKFNFSCLLKS